MSSLQLLPLRDQTFRLTSHEGPLLTVAPLTPLHGTTIRVFSESIMQKKSLNGLAHLLTEIF